MYNNWSYNANSKRFTGFTNSHQSVPGGLYLTRTDSMGNPVLVEQAIREDKIFRLTNGPMADILEEVNQFWSQGDKYRSLGYTHKRGFLLHGPPGCGKSAIINCLIEDVVRCDGIAIQVDYIDEFMCSVPKLRQIQKSTPILAILEDVDRGYDEKPLLELLDGASSLGDNLLFVMTTNYLEDVPTRIKYRPSRVDTLLEIGYPNEKQRREYLKKFSDDSNFINYVAGKTNEYSLAALKEIVVGCPIYGLTHTQAIERLSHTIGDEEPTINKDDK